METFEPSQEVLKRALELTRNVEPTNSMLGALGLYNAQHDRPRNPSEAPQKWAVELETNIERGRE